MVRCLLLLTGPVEFSKVSPSNEPRGSNVTRCRFIISVYELLHFEVFRGNYCMGISSAIVSPTNY